MAMKLIILCAIGFLFGCNCLCPSPEETKTIDLQLLKGKWWVTASTPVKGKNVTGDCIKFDVYIDSYTKKFIMNFTENNRMYNKSVKWAVVGEQLEQNRLEGSWQLSTSNNILKNIQHQIIETDYNEIVMIIVCVPYHHKLNFPKTEFAMLLSREKNLDNTTFENFKKTITPFTNYSAVRINNTCV